MIKPIETRYRGRLFRSRLEARWAVVFESLLLPWEYEKEGFHLPSKDYLPDFWLPRQKIWVEVKPFGFEESTTHLGELARESGNQVYLVEGQIPIIKNGFPENEQGNFFGTMFFTHPDAQDSEHMLCRCQFCGEYSVQWMGCSGRIQCCPENKVNGKRCSADEPTIVEAYSSARTRRFEHDESDQWT